jgi:DNA repair protein RadC
MKNLQYLELKKNPTEFPCVNITTADDAASFIRQFYSDDIGIFESFFLLLLNRGNKTIGYAKISQGGVAGTVVDTKIIAKYAIEHLASAVILAHNHPSGTLKPSEQDIVITKKVKEALSLFDIAVHDHIILTEDSYFSFEKEDLLI